MINKTIHSTGELISRLNELQHEGFIFRGHSSGKYILEPSGFRKDSLIKLSENFPNTVDTQRWFSSEAINNTINSWTKGMRPWYLGRLFDYILHLMRYNHALQEFYLAKGHTEENDQQLLDIFPRNHWTEQDTFERLFEFIYGRLVYLEDLDGNTLKEPYYPEESTGFDESWPQHYQFNTGILDWSFNPLVAIYFSLGSLLVETKKTERMLYTTSSLLPSHLAVFAYKQIDNSENAPVKILPGSLLKPNLRLLRQEGTFTCFTKTLQFFLMNDRLPSIEQYKPEEFKLIRFNMERTTANLMFLKAYIEGHGITESFLFPDKESIISAC